MTMSMTPGTVMDFHDLKNYASCNVMTKMSHKPLFYLPLEYTVLIFYFVAIKFYL